MANGLPSFIKEDKEKLLFNGGPNKEFLAYVPEKYFERSIAEQNGEYIDILGIFDYTVTDINTGKNIGLKNFRYPTVFTTNPSSVQKVRKVKLTNYMDEMDYRVLHYEDGDEIVTSTSTIQFVGNCEKLLNLWYMLGFILNTIPYDKLPDYILDNIALNGNGYGLNIQVIGFTVSELCRSQKDESVPFRLAKETDLHKYKSCSVKQISKLVSPYTAILSEDFDESIAYGMLNQTPKDTPLEKVLVGDTDTEE